MTPQTLTAIKAILEADHTVSDEDRNVVLTICREPRQAANGNGNGRPPRMLTPQEAAEILNTSLRTVFRLAREGRLTRVKLGTRSTRFRLHDIENLASCESSLS